MEDSIACLYPFGEDEDGYAHRVVGSPENSSRLVITRKHLPDLPGRGSRESTAPLDEDEDTNTKAVRKGKGLQLTFTHGTKAGPGFMLGTDRNSCDIVLPPLPRISRRHCYISFDAERRLIVRDCSTNGTTVEYDGKGGQKRRHFTWIIGGHRVPDDTDEIVIQLDINLRFQVVVSKPSFPDLYLENVNEFLQETATSASLPFGALGIQSNASTAAPSGMHTPNQDPILLEQETLGKGSFSTVVRVWDVSTGVEYASKRFHNLRKSDWRKEASLMRQISHVSIIRGTSSYILTFLPRSIWSSCTS